MHIGVLTYHRSHNYGAYLQAYSLAEKLRAEFPEHTIDIIDFNMKRAEKHYKEVIIKEDAKHSLLYNIKRFKAFKRAQLVLPLGKKLVSDSLSEFEETYRNLYDVIIVGSDEIWKIPGFRGFPNPYCKRQLPVVWQQRPAHEILSQETLRILKNS